MNYIKRFIKIAIILGLPAWVGWFYYSKLSFVHNYDNTVYAKMDYVEHSADKPEIIFLGSSRAAFLIDPRVIDSMCHVSSYNLGMPGMNMPELRMLLRKCVEEGKKPSILVLNIDPSSFDVKVPAFDFPDFLSYAACDTVIYHAMAFIQPEYRFKWRYPLYQFRQLSAMNDGLKIRALFRSAAALAGSVPGDEKDPARNTGKRGRTDYKGFDPQYGDYSESIARPFSMEFDEEGVVLLKDIIAFCRLENIRLILVTAPLYREYKKIFLNCDSILDRVSREAAVSKTPYFNFVGDPRYSGKENYFNFVHLNAFGARKYSLDLGRILQGFVSGGAVTGIDHTH
ncbi:MAG: hypothetical protein P4L51_18615 [Puia sp.]|nr:hypothetical protein [Puia sp.]